MSFSVRNPQMCHSILYLLTDSRSSYSSVIALLYTHNTFAFTNVLDLVSFSRSILPRSLDLIRRIEISDTRNYQDRAAQHRRLETWKEIWPTIAYMQSLREAKFGVVESCPPSLQHETDCEALGVWQSPQRGDQLQVCVDYIRLEQYVGDDNKFYWEGGCASNGTGTRWLLRPGCTVPEVETMQYGRCDNVRQLSIYPLR